MIYTVTLNPCLDYIMDVENMELDFINRSVKENILPGGKGINLSQVLKELGSDTTAIYFAGGFSGDYLNQLLKDRGIAVKYVKLMDEITRINVKIRSKSETAINAKGPKIKEDQLKELLFFLKGLTRDDFLVMSGNIPKGLPKSIYKDMIHVLNKRDTRFVVDTTGDALLSVLNDGPFLIKPNKEELEEVLGEKLRSIEAIIEGAKSLQERGARNVLVSLGDEGALLITEEDRIYNSSNPKGVVKNTVGAGDSMVAGFLHGYLMNQNYKDALLWGTAAGSATAFSDGLAKANEIVELLDDIVIKEIGGKS